MQHAAGHGDRNCQGCGSELGAGRYCAQCGRPVAGGPLGDPGQAPAAPPSAPPLEPPDPRTDTVVRALPPIPAGRPPAPPTGPPTGPPAGPPTASPSLPPPPVLPPPPSAARYPLFADDAPHLTGSTGAPAPSDPAHRSRSWLPWLAVPLVLLLVAGLGGALLLSGGEEPTEEAAATTAPTPQPEPPASAPVSPSTPAAEPAKPEEPADLARLAAASAPVTAPASTDTEGNVTRYEAGNLLDGVETTCWRMPGDGSGTEIVFTLDGPTEISTVGLINGYAKTVGSGPRALDWYAGNRRVGAVEWVFDDGTVVPQELEEIRTMQATEVDPVSTTTVTLRLVEVSAPGQGRARRDFTALSDVTLVGVPLP